MSIFIGLLTLRPCCAVLRSANFTVCVLPPSASVQVAHVFLRLKVAETLLCGKVAVISMFVFFQDPHCPLRVSGEAVRRTQLS